MQSITAGLIFLIGSIFDLYLLVLIIRLILSLSGVHYFNPITQLIIKLTKGLINPLKKIIPTIRGFELATVVAILGVATLKWILHFGISSHFPNLLGVMVLALGNTAQLTIQTFFYAILIQAILSWIQPNSSFSYTIYQFTNPLMQPIRRVMPSVGGFDLSPIPALILLQLMTIVIAEPLMSIGFNLAGV